MKLNTHTTTKTTATTTKKKPQQQQEFSFSRPFDPFPDYFKRWKKLFFGNEINSNLLDIKV